MKQLVVLLFLFSNFSVHGHQHHSITLDRVGNYRTGIFADGGSEIVAFDFFTKRIFSVNAHNRVVDVINIADPSSPSLLFSIDISPYGRVANSVAVKNGILAIAVENTDKQLPGQLVLMKTWEKCDLIRSIEIGPLPDMVTFSHDGKYILVANEGEPNSAYTVDPEGSISILNIRKGIMHAELKTVEFKDYNDRKTELLKAGIRIYGPNATVAQDFEPEYITVSSDSKKAWITLQENNAIAVVTLRDASIDTIFPLNYKNHNEYPNGFDASDKDGRITISQWPVYGMYLPDAIAVFNFRDKNFFITANEGDSRDYEGFSEETRIKDITLDPVAFPNASSLIEKSNIGRLKITTTMSDTDNDGDYDKLFSFGARSFAIFSENGEMVYESGSLLETITADYFPDFFNYNDEENNSFDSRSDDKGPEPEGVAIGKVNGETYAFIGLERISGIMIFNISNPYAPFFVDYVNTRDFSGNPELDNAGDISPEGVSFVPACQSPTGKPLVIAGYEISGSIAIFEVTSRRRCHN
ncbi:MAG TPA: choice-of-anchor I family protein [Chitinispirillaceae bacterium]|nr:choice-of-anchor I family protein [Chitinispirillaceae bacterium]